MSIATTESSLVSSTDESATSEDSESIFKQERKWIEDNLESFDDADVAMSEALGAKIPTGIDPTSEIPPKYETHPSLNALFDEADDFDDACSVDSLLQREYEWLDQNGFAIFDGQFISLRGEFDN